METRVLNGGGGAGTRDNKNGRKGRGDLCSQCCGFISPAQMADAVSEAEGWLLTSLLLGGFAGLRTAEMLRMDWADVDADAGEIHVRPGVMKDSGGFSERIVDFTPPLERRRKGLSGSGRLIPVSSRMFYARRKDFATALGWPNWPDNALRHSFATYHLGMTGNPGVTAFQMGHTSPAMVQRVYAVPARRADWQDWWAL